jgi:hypothetical protein
LNGGWNIHPMLEMIPLKQAHTRGKAKRNI